MQSQTLFKVPTLLRERIVQIKTSHGHNYNGKVLVLQLKISHRVPQQLKISENISQHCSTVGENISRTSSLVVVISPIGPCSDPGDELTMTAHCPLSDVMVMMKMGILHQPFHCDLPRDNLMTKHKAWFPAW